MKTSRYFVGAALLFWGWQTGLLAWAIPMAVLVEASWFVRTRWEFSFADLKRIWNLSVVLFFGAGIILYSSGETVRAPLKFAQWLPFQFFPMMLAQAYGSSEKIPLNVFSWFLRRSQKDLPGQKAINISFIYFGICLLAASATNLANPGFYPGMVLLIALALLIHRPLRLPRPVWMILIALVASLGHVGHQQLRALHGEVEGVLARWLVRLFNPRYNIDESRTAIGRIGRIQLSGEIVLRVRPESDQPPPDLLRDASYDVYKNGIWRSSQSEFGDVPVANDTAVLLPPKKLDFSVNISGYLRRGRGVLALPEGTFEIHKIPAVLKTNRLGMARVEDGPGLLSSVAYYGPGVTFDSEPTANDEIIPEMEKPVVEQIAAELNLAGKTERQKLQIIRQFFQENFSYSLEITRKHVDRSREKTPLGVFLTEVRSGHCEYFASAAVMLLRAADLPARYATGYFVDESGRHGKTYLVRQRDAHAWALVYHEDKKMWEEFDVTPVADERMAHFERSSWEAISDFFSNLKYQFSKWRWGETTYTSYLKWLLIPLILFLVWRIISSQRRQSLTASQESDQNINWPGMDSEFYLFDARMTAAGFGRNANEPLRDWQRRLASAIPGTASLDRIFNLHRRLRFDPQGITAEDRHVLKSEVNSALNTFELHRSKILETVAAHDHTVSH